MTEPETTPAPEERLPFENQGARERSSAAVLRTAVLTAPLVYGWLFILSLAFIMFVMRLELRFLAPLAFALLIAVPIVALVGFVSGVLLWMNPVSKTRMKVAILFTSALDVATIFYFFAYLVPDLL